MHRIVGLRNLLLLLAALAVMSSISLSNQLQFDERLESFFSDDHPDIEILHRSRREFGGDEFVIVAWTEAKLFQHDLPGDSDLERLVAERRWQPQLTDVAKERISGLAEQLNAIPGVDSSQSQHLVKMLDSAPKIRNVRRAMLNLFAGTLVGEDAKTTSIVLTLLSEADSSISRAATLREIRTTVAEFESDSAVAGEPVQIHDMFRLVEEDSHALFLVSLGILAAVLLFLFWGIRWTVGTIGLVLGVVVCTRAILVVSGSELSMVGSMLNSLVTVIGIATCMHVLVFYRDLRIESAQKNAELPAAEAAVETLNHMAAPVFWTCITTAVGFGSLLVSQITPVRSFSFMMCLAIGVILIACILIFPAMLASGRNLKAPSIAPLESWLDRGLAMICHWLERHPWKTGLTILIVTGLCIPGIFRLSIETNFSRNFRESSSIIQSLQFIESRLGGVGTWEVAFDAPEELSDEFLTDVLQLTEELKAVSQSPGALRVISLADVANMPPRVRGPRWMLERMERRFPELVDGMYNDKEHRMRIVLRSLEQQRAETRSQQIEDVRSIVQDFGDSHELSAPTASGMFVLLTEIIQSLLQDQLRSFLWATAGIFLCMTAAFRSVRIGVISLFPNIFPVALLLGSLGWADVPVNIGTAMISSVSMGLTVDSTIHYIFAFERARKTMTVSEALQHAHASAGRAVVFAHMALIAGFLVLTASRFIPLVYFGGLMSLSMFWGVFGDLVLLPLLLRWTTRVSSSATTV
jgi:predicted RND superfamily exporter protein